jgi:hypothetical protein
LVGLVGAHGDAFEVLDLAEEVFDEMPPFVHLLVDDEELCSARMLGDDNFGVAHFEFGDNGGAVERLVGDQRADIRLHPVVPVAERGRQVPPRATGSGDPQHRLNK